MASTYTTGFGIEKIGTGEQAGAWGTTTNHNADILDRIASYKAVALSGTTHTLTVREASPGSGTENLQDGMYRVIKFTGALGGNNTVTIAPNTSPAYFIIENATTDSGSSGPYSVILTQGSGANVTVQNGKNAIIYCDGAGSGAVVYNALADIQVGTLEVTGVAAIDGALTAAAATVTQLTSGGDILSDTDSTDSIGSSAVRWAGTWTDAINGVTSPTAQYTSAEETKLAGIEASADVTDATNVASALSNGVAALTSGEVTQLANIGTAAISAAEWGYVAASTQAYDSADHTKLNGIEALADVTDATNVLAGLVGQEAVATGFTGTLDGVLGGGTPAAATVTTIAATTFGTSSQNAYGARTVSTSGPSGGADGDIWYKY